MDWLGGSEDWDRERLDAVRRGLWDERRWERVWKSSGSISCKFNQVNMATSAVAGWVVY